MPGSSIVRSPEGQQFADALARNFGIEHDQAEGAMEALMPALVRGLERNTATPEGLAALLKALASGHHEAAIEDTGRLGNADTLTDGRAILGHILGGGATADKVAARAVGETGLSNAIIKQMLPMLAVFVMGWLFRNGRGALDDVLSKVPGLGGGGAAAPDIPSLPRTTPMGAPSQRPAMPGAGGSPLPMPDLDRITRRGPGDNPYGDLADAVRNGGGLAGTVRDVLGGMLGFNRGGIVSWIIKFVLLRFGWRILGFVVRRLFLRV